MKRPAHLVVLLSLMLSSCVSRFDPADSLGRISRTASERYQSFSLIQMDITTMPTDCIDLETNASCSPVIQLAILASSPMVMRGSGSGMVVAHRNGRTYVLTANHVCTEQLPDVSITRFMGRTIRVGLQHTMDLAAVDIAGETHSARWELSDSDHDICVISTEGEWGMPVPVAVEQPPMGSIVYNIAAPLGIFQEGMAPMFTGVYSGRADDGNHFYTIPAQPGSSGSPILNSSGYIVGVIHSVVSDFSHISLSSGTGEIRALVDQINQLD